MLLFLWRQLPLRWKKSMPSKKQNLQQLWQRRTFRSSKPEYILQICYGYCRKQIKRHPPPLESEHLQLLSIAAGAQSCLSSTIIPAELNGLPVKSLLDTGASESFVNEAVVRSA